MTTDPREQDHERRKELTATRTQEALTALRTAETALRYIPGKHWYHARAIEDLDIMIRVIESKRNE